MTIKVRIEDDGPRNECQPTARVEEWIALDFRKEALQPLSMVSSHAGIIPDYVVDTQKESHQPNYCRMGIFSDEMPQNIITRVVNYHLDIILMHGHETPTLIRNLRCTLDPDICPGIRFVKTIHIQKEEGIAPYKDCVDYFFFNDSNNLHDLKELSIIKA